MHRAALFAAAAALAACASVPMSAGDIDAAYDWNLDDGRALASAFSRDMRRLLAGDDIGSALQSLRDAGYDCATGEAHEARPDPISVCEKSFATRACQLDWEVTLEPEDGRVREVGAGFARDCVGKDRDWPEAKASAIDDQLAPASEPPD